MDSVNTITGKNEGLEWACAIEVLSGETECGDYGLVENYEDGALLAVIDGIGHGKEAAEAAKIAATVLKQYPRESVLSLMQLVHQRLRSTRGVVMTLASLNYRDNTLTWIGVGNVAASLHYINKAGQACDEPVMLRGGMVGVQLPPLKAEVIPVRGGDTLVFATDGISGWISLDLKPEKSVRETCEQMLKAYSKGDDDSLVMVARYLGGGNEEKT